MSADGVAEFLSSLDAKKPRAYILAITKQGQGAGAVGKTQVDEQLSHQTQTARIRRFFYVSPLRVLQFFLAIKIFNI